MINPRVEIDLIKIRHNTQKIVKICGSCGISVMGVTKVFCGNAHIAGAMLDGGVSFLADSRIENLMGLSHFHVPKVLLRIPMQSEIEETIRFADYSLNSELSTLKKISRECVKIGKNHKVILMVDLGDLREGIWYESIDDTVRLAVGMEGIELAGIGTNLTCYGGVIPTNKNLSLLSNIAKDIREKYKIPLPIVSGGNSSSLHLLINGGMPAGINNLRIGEAIVLGRETAFGKKISELYDDAFKVCGEIVEIKSKPSVPVGSVGMDAFGGVPEYIDRGIRKRAIVAVGRQDISFRGLTPLDDKAEVVGASSDHLIVDITESSQEYSIGGEMKFKMDYGCLLQSMTSGYVKKVIQK